MLVVHSSLSPLLVEITLLEGISGVQNCLVGLYASIFLKVLGHQFSLTSFRSVALRDCLIVVLTVEPAGKASVVYSYT